jgi:hypothetical protein
MATEADLQAVAMLALAATMFDSLGRTARLLSTHSFLNKLARARR